MKGGINEIGKSGRKKEGKRKGLYNKQEQIINNSKQWVQNQSSLSSTAYNFLQFQIINE